MENILFIVMGTSIQELNYAKGTLKCSEEIISLFLLHDQENKKMIEDSLECYCNLELVIFLTAPWDNRTAEQALILSENVKKRDIFSVVVTEHGIGQTGVRQERGKFLPLTDSFLVMPTVRPREYKAGECLFRKWIWKQNFYKKVNQFLFFLMQQNKEEGHGMTDLKDVVYILRNSSATFWSFGEAEGESRVRQAAQMCVDSIPSNVLSAATKIMIHLAVSESIGLDELEMACKVVEDVLPSDVTIVFGATFLDGSIEGTIRIDIMVAI